ncbi:MAG: T9SS type A sorting domain-containing protein [candidate division WOR-3 bacterium]
MILCLFILATISDDKAASERAKDRESPAPLILKASGSNPTVSKGLITWDFEADDGGFFAPPQWQVWGSWGWKQPLAGPGGGHSGTKCWGTNPDGDYDPGADWRLVMPAQNFSGLTKPIMSFWQWYYTETSYDSGWVEVSTDGGGNWVKVSPSYRGQSSGWVRAAIDLSAYAGQPSVLIRWRFVSDASVQYAGWYIDDVEILNISGLSNLYATSFEGDQGDLSPVNLGGLAPWQWGTPSSGPGGAYDGTRCWGTNLSGNYNNNADEAIQKGSNINASGYSYLEINFWQWYSTETGYDSGWVEVSTNGGGSWIKVSPSYRGTSGGWLRTTVDISPYASTQLMFRFRFKSDGSVNYPGWYVDSARVSGGAATTIAFWDFEADSGGYTAIPNGSGNYNEWEWGAAPGPIGAHSGTRCWGTDLDDLYFNRANMVLLGPVVDVSSWPRVILDFWHWRDADSYDTSFVEVSSNGGATWNRVATYTGSLRSWRAESLDVSAYKSSSFTFRFILKTDPSLADTGWYIDDVELDTFPRQLVPVYETPIKVTQGYLACYVENSSGDGYGTITAATDNMHIWGPDVSVLFAGASHDPWSSYLTVRVHETQRDYVGSTLVDSTLPPYAFVELNPYWLGSFWIRGNTDSLVTIWDGLPEGLRIEQHIYALGSDQQNARIQVMTHVINNSSQMRTVSVRYEWDIHVQTTDAPYLRGFLGGWGPWYTWENNWWGSGIRDYYEENQNPSLPNPYWHYLSCKWAPWPPPPTPPDTFFFVRWPLAFNTAFDVPYMADGRDSLPLNWDDCVVYMWVQRGIAPGDTFTAIEYIWSPVQEPISKEENPAGSGFVGLMCPNPTRAGDEMWFGLSSAQRVEIKLYSADGRLINTLFSGKADGGAHSLSVPRVPSGAYFLLMDAERDGRFTRKLLISGER